MKYTFLLCSERSGSNLITKIMDAHSEYCGPPPSHIIRTFAQNLGNYLPLGSDVNWDYLLTDAADLLSCQLGKWKSKVSKDVLANHVQERSLPAMLRYVHEKEAGAHGKVKLFVKENRAYRFLPFLLLAFPDSNFVYLHRDPRDVALSWKLSPNHPGGVMKATTVWAEDQEAFWMNYKVLRSFGRAHRVGYEELLTAPEQTVQKLCEFLTIDYEPQMLEYHQQAHTRENANRLKDWENLGKPLLEKNFNKYRDGLSELEIRYVEHIAGGMIEKLGYSQEYPKPDDPDKLLADVQQLESGLVKTPAEMTKGEQAIRAKRLQVIHQIVNRKSAQTF